MLSKESSLVNQLIYSTMKKLLLFFLFISIKCIYSQNLANLYKQVNSSVVVIDVVSVGSEGEGVSRRLVTQESQGSGFLVSNEGHIWTAAHVIQSAEVITVEFLDGDRYEADVLASNPNADVALLKIKEEFVLKNKKIVTIADSDKVMIGEDVFVLGAPHGFKQSLSRGILSGRHIPENLSNDFIKVEFLQTDAAINPGNSGGPVFNMKGEVIGIASRIYTMSGGFDGIGFAVTSNIANKLLMEEPNIWTGMEGKLVTGVLAKALNIPQKSGLLILNASTKGAAGKLGLRGGEIPAVIDGEEILIGGDVILEIAGIKFENEKSIFLIREKITSFQKGDSISITVLRDGKIGSLKFPKQ
ncbi:S1C family serine protease [Aquimarina sp. 2201CG5-10]|uniref:S1C family serine protease n=1 Tax=Aquimarina callyspongiae TaxID=3098150 RepID=UPI002AB52019|nr:trypsin-like peptidase domain-containing protein [Aquimarina sp. 2201CG5-10]MDY8135962.1 trypsin-like peptidase domain-containing protein [Aquimarina sp. 2201CG5-10]